MKKELTADGCVINECKIGRYDKYEPNNTFDNEAKIFFVLRWE